MTSLSVSLKIAYSAISAVQVQTSVTSSNISNADTEGYTKKTANKVSTVVASIGTGTAITSVTSNVDGMLVKSLVSATSALGESQTTYNYLDQLQSMLGSVSDSDSGTSLANTLASLEDAILALEDSPDDASLQAAVVESLDAVATQLQDTSASIQSLRSDTDEEIDTSVDSVNELLEQIDDLNDQITTAAALGESTADLEDSRNTALEHLSQYMDVSYFVNSSGDMQIYTTSGQALLDSEVHELSYAAASIVTSETTYPDDFSGITVSGVDITSQIKSGSIAALVELRDETLPAAQEELDELATTLAQTLNSIHNSGTSVPAAATLTGTTSVTGTDTFSGSGTVRIAVTEEDGNLVSYQDLNLSDYDTVDGLVDAIDAISGLTASIDSSGHVVITADSTSNGISINEMTSSVGTAGQGLSDWLGLNDLVTCTGASDFSVRSDILSDTSLLSIAVLDSSTSLTTGDSVVSEGSGSIVSALYDAFVDPASFDAAGSLGTSTSTFASYAASIVSEIASQASSAETDYTSKETAQSTLADTLSSESGVNVDEETATLTELQNLYAAAAQIISIVEQMYNSLLDAIS
jgi:flagellar hook-associated protein 1